MGKVIEVFPIGVEIVGLQDIQRPGGRQSGLQMPEDGSERILTHVFEKITGKGEIHRRWLQKAKIGYVAHLAFDAGGEKRREAVPYVHGDSAPCAHVIDEVTVSC